MALFGRRKKNRPGTTRSASGADLDHLARFAETRSGVEAYIEPRTTVTEATLVLVAADGEWTRRRVAGPEQASDFARKRSMPIYDAGVGGYPQRMRDYTARRKASGQTGVPGIDGPSV